MTHIKTSGSTIKWLILASLLFSSHAYGLPQFDECGVLHEKISKNNHLLSLDETYYYQDKDNGISLKYDLNKSVEDSSFERWVLQRDEYQNVLLAYLEPALFQKHRIPPNTKITKLNDRPVSTLDDEVIIELISKPVDIEFGKPFTSRKINLSPKARKRLRVLVNFETREIDTIDSKLSRYNVNFLHTLVWIDDRITSLARKTFNEALHATEPANDRTKTTSESGFFCSFTEREFQSLGIFEPDIIISNAVSLEGDATKTIYEMEFYAKTSSEDEDYLEIRKEVDGIGTFKSNFNFRAFPFDSQKLAFSFQVNQNQLSTTHFVIPFFSAYTAEELTRGFTNLRMQEWEKTGIGYEFFYVQDIGDETFQSGITYFTYVERNTNYFLTKVMLPILTILLVSYSVFFIRISDLESRLTVSVVCLLSLIAYTFIIDKDLPKLSYLTIMDYMVLVSYFFASLSTIGAIIVHNISQRSTAVALKTNRLVRLYLPFLYCLIFAAICGVIIYESSNTIKMLS